MKRKHFILALVAMLWSFSFSAYADDVIVVNSWAELKAALEANDGVQRSAARQRSTAMRTTSTASGKTEIPNTPYYYEDFQTTKIQLGNDVVYDDALPIAKSNGTTLDLNGHKVLGSSESAEHAYPFYNYGKFLVVDNSKDGTGAIYCGVKSGIKEDGISINEEAVFVMTGGNIICTHDSEDDAAVVNYGIAYITGGTIEGANNAVLNQDGATMNILSGALITGKVSGTGITAPPGVYTVATIGDAKYTSLNAAFAAAKEGETVKMLADATPDLTSQRAITKAAVIDLGGKTLTLTEDDLYFGTTTFQNGTIVVDPSVVASTAVFWMFENQTLTFDDVDIVATGVTGTYLIGINGGTGSAVNLLNGSSINIDNTEKAALTAVIADNGNGNSVTIKDSKIEITNVDARLYLGGTNGSVTVEDSDIDLNGVKEGFYLRAGQVLSIEGSSTVDITLNSTVGRYGINLTDFTSAYTKAGTATVNATIGELQAAAQIGTTKYLTLQAAIDAAVDGDEIMLKEDITEDVTITQKANLDLVINGDGKRFTGIMTVFGDARHDGAETLAIKNVNFVAKAGADACILSPDRTAQNPARYSYSHNVTVENCTFTDPDGTVNCAAIRQNDGGDRNWTVTKCTVDNTMHSLLQVNNVEGMLTVTECTVNSKNGLNLNATINATITGNNINVKGYALRSGVSSGGNLGTAKTLVLKNNTLKSACADGDAVIMFRASSVDMDLSMTENVVSGTTHISGNTAATKLAIDANYWDSKSAPVVAEGSPAINVNSYYSDEALSNLVRNHFGGSIVGYTTDYRIWGDAWGNAVSSFVVKVLDAEGNVMGTTSLNNVDGIIDGDVNVTWGINFVGASNDPYWTWEWTARPSVNKMPAKVQLLIDGEQVAEGPVKLNAPDDLKKIVAATADADGNITGCYTTLNDAVAKGDHVAILVPGTYSVPTGKDLTITGVDGVVFDNIGAKNMGGADVTFNNVTFDYYPNVNYTGLQHSGNLVYNNCTINGQVFLYGQSETFNNCTFNQNSADAYNVWTYGAKKVAFNECTFNSVGKSVLVYNEGAGATDLVVTETEFIASAAVEGKAAIEIDTHKMPGQTTITIDGETTAEGFANGSVSGNSLWNNKMGNDNDANNDITVTVDDDVVLQPVFDAQIGTAQYRTLREAISAVKDGETITLLRDVAYDVTITQTADVDVTIDGNNMKFDGTIYLQGNSRHTGAETLTIKNINFETADAVRDFISCNDGGDAQIRYAHNVTIENCNFTATTANNTVVAARFRQCYNMKIVGGTFTNLFSPMWATGGSNITVEGVKVPSSVEGLSFGTATNVSVKNVELTAQKHGVRVDASQATSLTVSGSKIDAFIPVVVRNASADYNLTFAGDNTMTEGNDDNLWCAIGTTEYKESGTMPTAATGRVKVTLNDTGLNAEGIYGNFVPAAKIGEIEYATLADAIAAANAGDVVKVFAGTYAVPTMKAGITIEGEVDSEGKSTVLLEGTLSGTLDNLTLKNLHIKGGNAQRWAYANGNLVFENVTFEATSVYAIHFDGIKEGTTLLYKNCTIIGWAALGGSPESCKFEGCTIKDNGTYGVIRTYFDTEIKDCTFDVANAKTDDVYQDGIHVVGDAEAVVDGCTNTNGEMTELVNISGKSVVVLDGVEIKNFAKIGDTHYRSFAEALNAVQAGETITLIRDVTVAEGETAEINGFNLTAEEGVKLINNGTVTVTGEAASLNIATFEGNPIELRNGKLVDSNIGANAKAETNTVNAFGTNNISGTTEIGGILSVGYSGSPAEQVVVNITGNFKCTNVLVGSSNESVLNLGVAESSRTTAHFGQLGAFGDVNVANADVTYGYAFIRNDFKATNSTFEIKGGVNTYFSGNAKVVLDNSTWNLPGYANIGSYGGYMYGNADVTLKNGSSITATNLGVELQEGKEVKLTLEDTSSLTATKLSNQGSIVLASTEATITANSGVSNITTTVADYKLAYVDGAYKVVAKEYVAYIGTQGYESLAEALTAAADGATVSLSWAEGNPAIAMNGAVFGKSVTITGNANVDWSKGFLFVGRGGEGNATVIFDGANLTSASNSSSNGIHVSGREKDTDNKYDGTLVIKNSTIALDYLINRGAITVDGATLTVKNGFGIAGRPASETESGADATATITLENNAKLVVNNHNGMGLGQAATVLEGYGVMNVNSGSTFETTQAFNVSAKGQMNVNGGTVKITANLANNGTVYVAGASTLDAAVAGEGWFYMNGVTLGADTKLDGAKVAFINGTNNVVGSTIKNGWFNVGVGQNAEAEKAAAFAQANGITLDDVTVNVSENANIGGNGEAYSGWVGSAYSADKTQHTYALNVKNSLAAFGYMHVSKDGTFTVDGRSANDNKYTYDNANVNFYAGDFIINGVVTLNNADAWVKYTKMSVDHVGGVLNINGDTKYESSIHNGSNTGTSLVYYKAGKVNVAETAIVEIDNATNFVDGAELNIAGNVTAKGAITGNGAINFTNDAATLTTATTGLTIGYNLNADKKVVYTEGAYKVAEKLYVAQIGDAKYESLQEAIEAVAEGQTIVLIDNITFTTGANGSTNGISYTRGVSFTLDLNGKTVASDLGNIALRFKIGDGNDVTDTEVTVTIKNGKIISGSNNWCAISAATADNSNNKLTMNLTDLVVEANKGGDFAVKSWAGAVVNAYNVDITTNYAGGFYACGGEMVLDENCSVEQKGLHTAPYMSYAFGVGNGTGKMTINGGTYTAAPAAAADAYNQGASHGSGLGGVMSSGGTLIINGGTFTNDNFGDAAPTAPRALLYADAGAKVEINGGTFNAMAMIVDPTNNTGDASKNAEVTVKGGTFTADPADAPYGLVKIAEGYTLVDNGNGTYTVATAAVKVGDTYYASLEAGLKALTDGATLTFLEDITVTEAWDERYTGGRISANNVTIDGNGKTITFACDIQDGGNYNAPFRIQGTAATIKNLTIDMSEATNSKFARLRAISSGATDLTVTNCTFIGNTDYTNSRAIIFGEGSQNIPGTDINISECTFQNWRYGVTDNENGKDVGNVTVTGNIFENSSVQISASENVTFDKNTLVGGYVNITSYTNKAGLSVHATENTLDAEKVNEITVNPSGIYAQGGFSIPVAEVGGAYYLTLASAISKANGATVTVLDDIILSEAVEVKKTAAVLNLNGNSITPAADATMTGGPIRLLDGADLIITGEGEISNNGNENVYAAVSILGKAKLTVNGGKLTGYYYGIAGNGTSADGAEIFINGGTIAGVEGTGFGIYHPQDGTLTVAGGTVTGATGIYFKSGNLAISGGTIHGTGEEAAYGYTGSGANATGDALVIENVNHNTGYDAVGTISITGGTFISDWAAPIASYAPEFSTAKVEFLGKDCGALFNNNNIDESLLVVGYQVTKEAGAEYYGVEHTYRRESLTIVDGDYTKFENDTEIVIGTLTYERTFKNSYWQALYVPFDIPIEALGEEFAVSYINDVHSYDNNHDGVIDEMYMEYIDIHNGTLKANYPYLIRAVNASADSPVTMRLVPDQNALLYKTEENYVECSSVFMRFKVSGTYKRLEGTEIGYAISNGIWKEAGSNAGLNPFRLRLTMEAINGAPVKVDPAALNSISLRNRNGETTGVECLIEVEGQTVDYIYDLQGRRVLEPQKGGLYIVNGKKVIF